MAYIKLIKVKVKFRYKDYSRALVKSIEQLMYNAGGVFADTVANRSIMSPGVSGIPVKTGMAKGAMRAKVRKFSGGYGSVKSILGIEIPIRPIEKRRGKNPREGARLTSYTFSRSPKGRRYSFGFETNVYHWILNAFNAMGYKNPQKKTPWYVFKDGEMAFKEYIINNIDKVSPKINDFIYEG